LKSGHQKFSLRLPGAERPIFAYLNHDVCADYFPAEEPKIKCLLYWDKVALPVTQGQRVGELHLLAAGNDTFIKSVPLFAEHDVDFTFWHRLSHSSIWKWAIIAAVAALLAGILLLRRR
jgi:D-alanyl-D-alanine carboxypeptidase (penicillin-binding protein 5/6)